MCETDFASILSALKVTKSRGYLLSSTSPNHNTDGYADLTVTRNTDTVQFHIKGIDAVKSGYETEIRQYIDFYAGERGYLAAVAVTLL